MSRSIPMSDLVLRSQRRADAEGNAQISTPEWKSLVSEMYGQLYSTAVKSGMHYFYSTTTVTATGATSYPLPTDHDQTIGVERVTNATSGSTMQLDELMVQERNAFSGVTGDATAYTVFGTSLQLWPRPLSGSYILTYIPQSPDLSAIADSTVVDVLTSDGEALMIWGTAVKAKAKLGTLTNNDVEEREAALQRFIEDVNLRAAQNPRRKVVQRSTLVDIWSDEYGLMSDPASWRFR